MTRPVSLLALLCLVAGLWASDASAQTCRTWQPSNTVVSPSGASYTGARALYKSPGEAAEEIRAWCSANAGGVNANACATGTCSGGGYPQSYTVSISGTWPSSLRANVTRICPNGSAYPSQWQQNLTAATDAEGCPSCPPAGDTITGLLPSRIAPSGSIDVFGCEFKATGPRVCTSTGCIAEVVSTGRPSSSTQQGSNAEKAAEGSCKVDGGAQVCAEPRTDGRNCGTVNGDRVCIDAAAPGQCVAYQSGGVACVVSGSTPNAAAPSTPPAPNNGTPGQPASPAAEVTDGSNTANYYPPSTVSGSTTAPTTVPAPDRNPTGVSSGSSGGSGSTSGTVNTQSQDTADGECTGDECNGTSGAIPTLEETPTFQQITSAYWSSLQAAPIIAAVNSVSTSLPAANCPVWSTALGYLNTTLTFDVHCELFANIAPLLSAVMLAVWSILGIVIILRA